MLNLTDTIKTATWYNVPAPSDSAANLGVRVWSDVEIFGPVSQKISSQPIAQFSNQTIEWQGAIIIVSLLSLYCYVLFRYRVEIRASLKAAFSLEDTLFIFENLTLDFARFLRFAQLIVVCSLAVMISAFIDRWQQLWVVGALIASIWFILQLSSAGSYIVSKFDYNNERWQSIRSITKLNDAIISIAICPVVLILGTTQYLWVAIAAFAALVLYHFFRLLKYFKLSGFSTLQWILYLCAVETIPFTLLWGATRWVNFLH